MRRRLFTALSLVACVGAAVLWGLSAFRPIVVSWGNSTTATGYVIAVGSGEIGFQQHWGVKPFPWDTGALSVRGRHLNGDTGGDLVGGNRLGFYYYRSTTAIYEYDLSRSKRSVLPGRYGNPRQFGVALIWPLLLGLPLSAAAALRLWVLAVDRLHRDRGRLCGRCGYNLTGNTSGVCPECGTPTTAEMKA